MDNILRIEKICDYTFKNKELLNTAFTHSSFSNESKNVDSNQRLEFLGDAVLDLVISEYIFLKFADLPEGELSKLRASIVCEQNLANHTRPLGIAQFLIMGKGEEASGGKDRDSVIADLFESVVGAIFVDGGIEAAKKFVLLNLEKSINSLKFSFKDVDHKTKLQEEIQKSSREPLEYIVVDEQGPAHEKTFNVEVLHCGKVLGFGTGKTKKEAEQFAASEALKNIASVRRA